ncbi:hypothetical protein D9756_010348 [Leucocoprinus leucothites]|uniref:Uncharacterized protein n=1 Tax=Leucocoprinus leucothites TaxID=201217 RepID=A0A8H5CRS0_9AGAR|nr:hypothetical protein D9756_010348 [Leucoagaricus leucothites]
MCLANCGRDVDILSQRTGLPRDDFSGVPRQGGVGEMISKLRHLQPSAELRQTFQYNSLMYESHSHIPSSHPVSSPTYSAAETEPRRTFANGSQDHMSVLARGINGTKRATVPYFARPGEKGISVSVLLNEGKHPYMGEQAIPSHVDDHAATGVTVTKRKASYPELLELSHPLSDILHISRAAKSTVHINGDTLIAATNPLNTAETTQGTRSLNDNLAIIWTNYTRHTQLLPPRTTFHPARSPRTKDIQPPTIRYSLNLPCLFFTLPLLLHPPARLATCSPILNETNLTIPTLIVHLKGSCVTHLQLQHLDANLLNLTIIWSIAEVQRKEGLATSPPSPPIMDSCIASPIRPRDKGQTPLHIDHGRDAADRDILLGLDEYFEVEWAIREEDEGLVFKGGFWGMEGSDARRRLELGRRALKFGLRGREF